MVTRIPFHKPNKGALSLLTEFHALHYPIVQQDSLKKLFCSKNALVFLK